MGAAVRRCGAFVAKFCDVVPQQAKALIDPMISRRVNTGGLPGDSPVWDPRSFRLRNFLAIVFAAVLIAAMLRHVLHVYGGIPREEIRADAFIAILIVAAVTVFFQRVSRRR